MLTQWCYMNSRQPKKQRKLHYTSQLHRKHKAIVATLSDKLREEYGIRSLPVRKGDTVELMRGSSRGHTGKVADVDLRAERISVEGVTLHKADGTERFYPVHPSKVRITKIGSDDKRRIEGEKQ